MTMPAVSGQGLKRLAVCADDWGLSRGIEGGIISLAERGRITAVSCLVGVRREASGWHQLLRLAGQVEIGLHFCLTSLPPIVSAASIPSLVEPDGRLLPPGRLLGACLRGQVEVQHVRRELDAQFQQFLDLAGRLPDFLDGHHHVHQLPVVRRAVLDYVSEREMPLFYVRNTHADLSTVWRQSIDVAKTLALAALGGAWKRALEAKGIRTNAGFGGPYDWRHAERFPRYVDRFLRFSCHGGLIMTHPGFKDPDTARYDPLDGGREHELTHLAGPIFLAQLDRNRVRLSPLSATFA